MKEKKSNTYENLKKGCTIGEVYDPLVKYAITGNQEGHKYLEAVAEFIFDNNDSCVSLEDGMEAAKYNLGYWCQYYDEKIASKTKEFYSLGQERRTLFGK